MKSFYRWVADHTGLCKVLLFLLLAAFTVYAASFEYISFLTVYLIDLLIWFVFGRFLSTVPVKLLQEPLEQLNQHCDPQPLLEETQRQLARKFDGPHRQLLEINRAVALRDMGQTAAAAQILEAINIDKFPGTSPFMKHVYYHNLCDICYLLGRKEEGRIWRRKYMQIYQDLPSVKAKQELTVSIDIMECEILYHEGDYEDALRKINSVQLPHPRRIVDAAMLAAKCHIALEEPDKAREKLNYVVEHGNKLCIAQEANELLETLN